MQGIEKTRTCARAREHDARRVPHDDPRPMPVKHGPARSPEAPDTQNTSVFASPDAGRRQSALYLPSAACNMLPRPDIALLAWGTPVQSISTLETEADMKTYLKESDSRSGTRKRARSESCAQRPSYTWIARPERNASHAYLAPDGDGNVSDQHSEKKRRLTRKPPCGQRQGEPPD